MWNRLSEIAATRSSKALRIATCEAAIGTLAIHTHILQVRCPQFPQISADKKIANKMEVRHSTVKTGALHDG